MFMEFPSEQMNQTTDQNITLTFCSHELSNMHFLHECLHSGVCHHKQALESCE